MRIITENALRRKGFINETIDGKKTGKFIMYYYRPNTNITEFTIKLGKYSSSIWMLNLNHYNKWSGQSMIDSLEALNEYIENFTCNFNVLSKIQRPYLLDLGFRMQNSSTFIWIGDFGASITVKSIGDAENSYYCEIKDIDKDVHIKIRSVGEFRRFLYSNDLLPILEQKYM